MPIERSLEFILAALFLARCGRREGGHVLPPAQLGTDNWNSAYACFYDALSAERTLKGFHNSLKATRDQFDSHLDSGRRGFRSGEDPKPLPMRDAQVWSGWRFKSDDELWEAVRPYADVSVASAPARLLDDIRAAELTLSTADRQVGMRTDGTRKAVISYRRERSPALRAAAFRHHGFDCMGCGFSFEQQYGAWGRGFAEVHHLQMLANAPDDGRSTHPIDDLAVLCSNCHSMVHRRPKVALTLDELRAMVASQRSRTR